MSRIWTILTLVSALGVTLLSQSTVDPERTAGIRVMRMINTAENVVLQQSGKYVGLAELLDHRAMGGARADFATNGSVVFYQGKQVRLVLSPDSSQYHAMVVPVDTCGTAVFSDERGLIYTGKVLDCK